MDSSIDSSGMKWSYYDPNWVFSMISLIIDIKDSRAD